MTDLFLILLFAILLTLAWRLWVHGVRAAREEDRQSLPDKQEWLTYLETKQQDIRSAREWSK